MHHKVCFVVTVRQLEIGLFKKTKLGVSCQQHVCNVLNHANNMVNHSNNVINHATSCQQCAKSCQQSAYSCQKCINPSLRTWAAPWRTSRVIMVTTWREQQRRQTIEQAHFRKEQSTLTLKLTQTVSEWEVCQTRESRVSQDRF